MLEKVNKSCNSNWLSRMQKNGYILSAMIEKNFKVQYRGSFLGILWTVLNPLLNMVVLVLVFSNLFGSSPEVGIYPIYLLVGTIVFNMVRQSTIQSLDSLVMNSDLIKKVKISYSIFPLSNLFSALVNFAMTFIALIAIMLIVGQRFYWTLILIITIIPAIMLFSLGISLFLSAVYVFFRDIKHLYDVGMTLWNYLTPIFYSVSVINIGWVSKIVKLNPMYHFVTAARGLIQWGVIPSITEYLIMYGWAFGLLVFGLLVFKLLRKKYILYI